MDRHRSRLNLAAVIPALVLAWAIARNAVDLPVADQWELVPLFTALDQRQLSIGALFAVHNEHRPVFPRMFSLGVGSLTGWDVRYEMWANFAVACATVVALARLLDTTSSKPALRAGLVFLMAMTVLNPANDETWLFGFLGIIVPPLCLAVGLILAVGSRSLRLQVAMCAALALAASFSAANGLLVWVLGLAIVCCSPACTDRRSRLTTSAVWMLGLAGVIVLYFWRFPATHQMQATLQAGLLLEGAGYALSVLGYPLAAGVRGDVAHVSALLGALLLMVFTLVSWWTWTTEDRSVRAWVVLGGFSIASAAMVTVGRLGAEGMDAPLPTRYLIVAGPLVIATAVLAISICERSGQRGRARATQVSVALLSTFIVLVSLGTFAGLERMSATREQSLGGKALLAFIDHVVEPDLAKTVYPFVGFLRQHAQAVNRLGFLRPPLVPRPWRPATSQPVQPTTLSGRFDELALSDSGLRAEGWAVLLDRGEPADAVVLGVETSDGCCTVVGVSYVHLPARGFDRLRRPMLARARWSKQIDASRIPPHTTRMRAWAYDARTGELTELAGQHLIPARASP